MTEKAQAVPTWQRIVLPVSIVLNLFLIAVIGGHLLRSPLREVSYRGPFARALAHAEAVLPADDAAKFSAAVKGGAPHYMKAAQQLREARSEVERQILASQFDPEGVRRALATWETAWRQFFDDFSGTLVEALAEISPEGRRKLVAERRTDRVKLP